MQTNFSLTELNDPEVQHADDILRKCVHCGFCTATCPTYVLLGDELDSPRGRIYLIKEMLQQRLSPKAKVVRHIDRCLSCLACITTCPSGVNYMHLVDRARMHIEKSFRRPLWEAIVRWSLSTILPNRRLFGIAVSFARFLRPVHVLLPAKLARLWNLIPQTRPALRDTTALNELAKSTNPKIRVGLLPGCVQLLLEPSINEATTRVLNRHNCEVKIPEGTGCCGALSHHLGKTDVAKQYAQANIKSWYAELESGNIDSIVANASGCGTMLKDYGHIFRNDPIWAERAAAISKRCFDVSEILSDLEISATTSSSIKVTYNSACSLQHGQKLHQKPKALLKRCGYNVIDTPESHLCCGSAGTYNILQPTLSDQLLERKLANIAKTSGEVIATGNIGCIIQLRRGAEKPVVHTVELLDWATGGPKPKALLGQ